MKTFAFQNAIKRLFVVKPGAITISNRNYHLIIVLLFAWYLFQMLYFAISIRPGISPDEMYHIELSVLHAESKSIRLADTPETYKYGAISTQAYLYHFAMGKLLLLNVFNLNDVLYLRFINIAFSLITLQILLLLMREITSNRLIHFAVLVLATNILMFVFLSAMVSYDNLTNLFAAASFLYLVRFIKNYHITNLLLLMLVLSVGSLVKYAILPLVLIHFLAILYLLIKRILMKQLLLSGRLKIREIVLIVTAAIFITAGYNLYGPTLNKYKTLRPSAGKVIGSENARQHSGIARAHMEAHETRASREMYSFGAYAIRYYFRIIETTFGISAHTILARPAKDQIFHQLLLIAMVIAALINYRQLPMKEILTILLLASIAYFLVAFAKNYLTYRQLVIFGAGLHGRYIFPVLAPILVFLTFGLLYRLTDFKKLVFLFIGTLLLAWQSFFWFLARVDQTWFWV